MAINVNINVSPLGAAVLSQTNPAAQSWIRVETNGAITLRTAAETLSDLGAQAAGAYVTAVTASGNIASSGGATPNITFTGVLPTANGGTAVNIASAALVLGTASTTAGQLTLSNATNAFTQTIRGTNPAASVIYDLPTTAPTLGQVLSATAPAAGVVTLSWATASSGITINSTAITSGTANRILFENSSNQVSESNTNFYFETGLNYGNCIYAPERSGTITTNKSTSAFGNRALRSLTSGDGNTAFGARALEGVTTQNNNTAIGVLNGLYSPVQSIFVGYGAGFSTGTDANYSVMITTNPSLNNLGGLASCILLGYNCGGLTASHQGMLGSNDSNGYISDWYFNGVTHTAPYSVTLNASGASGKNVAGCTYTHAGSKGTGSGTPGTLVFKTSTTLGSGTTLQSLVSRLTISGGAVTTDASTATWADALDFVFGTTTGTKIGTGTTQKIGFWNATPLAQQTTASAASTFVANTSLIANDTATFDGYTLGQVVKVLRNLGILA